MKTRSQKLTARFLPESGFEVQPSPPEPDRAVQETRLEMLKRRLLREQLEQAPVPELNSSLDRAANEAAALAWVTRYPLLVFPALFEEKAAAAIARAARQEAILQRSQELMAL
jgi:hypothetical protein